MSSKFKPSVKTSALSLKGKSKFKSVQTSQQSRKFHICIKGNCKYGTSCRRKCKQHKKLFSHINYSHQGLVSDCPL